MNSKTFYRTFLLMLTTAAMVSCNPPVNKSIQLAGEWELCLDSTNVRNLNQLSFNLNVNLPGTLDEAGIGTENSMKPELKREIMLHLQRKHEYVGKAWYRKTITVPELKIPAKAILKLERVIWKSTVYVDGKLAGEANSLSTSHRHDLTEFLTPGEHELLICIDNSRQFILNSHDMAHAYTEQTQIKWNGILGEFAINFYPIPELEEIQIHPDFGIKKLPLKQFLMWIKIPGFSLK
jgi:beta-galactosidase/beta-glucuronidase